MAERRMFAKTIVDSDAFLDMALSTQALYFHLSMRADDDGFLNNPKKILRMVGAGESELKTLLDKKFILLFESGVVVIKHWKMHNYIRSDRYKKTIYTEELQQLEERDNKSYTRCLPLGIPDDNQLDTQVRLGKDRIRKDMYIDIDPVEEKSKEKSNEEDFKKIRKTFPGTMVISAAKKKLPNLIKKYGSEQMLKTVERYIEHVEQIRKKEQPNLSYMMESTFWNGRYEDYLDENYTGTEKKEAVKLQDVEFEIVGE